MDKSVAVTWFAFSDVLPFIDDGLVNLCFVSDVRVLLRGGVLGPHCCVIVACVSGRTRLFRSSYVREGWMSLVPEFVEHGCGVLELVLLVASNEVM